MFNSKSALLSRYLLIGSVLFAGAILPTSVQAMNWQGWYFGGAVGYNWAKVHAVDVSGYNAAGATINYNANGGMVGLHAGYHWLISDRWLIGLRSEFGAMHVDGSGQYGPYVGVRLPTDSRASLDECLYYALLARLGYVIPNPEMLLYVKGGYAWADEDYSFIDTDPTGTTLVRGFGVSKWVPAWTLGVGVEVPIAALPGWTGGLSYNYYKFNSVSHTATDAGGGLNTFRHKAEKQSLRAEFTFHF